MSIKIKILIFIIFIILIPITILGFLSFYEAKEGLIYLAKSQMEIMAVNQINKIRSKLEFILRSDPNLINTEDVIAGLIEDELYNEKISQKGYIYIINDEGRVLIHPKREKKINRENYLKSKYKDLQRVTYRMIHEKRGFDSFFDENGGMYVYFIQYDEGEVITGSTVIDPIFKLNWTLGVVMPQEHILMAARIIEKIFIITAIISLIFSTILGFLLVKVTVIDNINKLVDATKNITTNEDFHLDNLSKDEIGILGKSFNNMILEIKETKQRLIKQEKLKKELELAEKIQTCLIPEIPESKTYDIAASMIPASEVGGDYYDILKKDEDIWFGIGDVSGHGLDAGLIMMMAQTAFSSLLLSNKLITPKQLIENVNKTLYNNIRIRMKEKHFMTAVYLCADSKGEINIAGSHLDILIYRNKTKQIESIKTKGVWLGIIPEIHNKIFNNTIRLNKNDIMILYTDGLTEARNKNKELYGVERLKNIIISSRKLSNANKIKESIIKNVFGYLHNQIDDISLIVVKKK